MHETLPAAKHAAIAATGILVCSGRQKRVQTWRCGGILQQGGIIGGEQLLEVLLRNELQRHVHRRNVQQLEPVLRSSDGQALSGCQQYRRCRYETSARYGADDARAIFFRVLGFLNQNVTHTCCCISAPAIKTQGFTLLVEPGVGKRHTASSGRPQALQRAACLTMHVPVGDMDRALRCGYSGPRSCTAMTEE